MPAGSSRGGGGAWRRLSGDSRGQAMTEYVILSSVMIAAAAYLYHPDNRVFSGIRHVYEKTKLVVAWPGP